MHNEKPLITVIVPTYNSPDLKSTLQSVLIQNYPRIQLIVADDASDAFSCDAVQTFIHEHAGSNLEDYVVFQNQQNVGTVRNLNGALLKSRGTYIFNLAGDDCFFDERVLSDWVDAFTLTGAQVMTGYRAIYDDQLKNLSHIAPTTAQVKKIRTLTPAKLFEDIKRTNYIFGCCTARTAESFKKYGLFDEKYRLLEDHPMNLKQLRLGEPIVFFERIVVKYRGGGASSPGMYNTVYQQDVDTLLHCEVLPYTRHPYCARWDHYQWKRDQKLCKVRTERLQKYGGNKGMRLLIQIAYYLHHPWRTICRIPARVLKWLNKGEKQGWKSES